jgi:hypothetical protein
VLCLRESQAPTKGAAATPSAGGNAQSVAGTVTHAIGSIGSAAVQKTIEAAQYARGVVEGIAGTEIDVSELGKKLERTAIDAQKTVQAQAGAVQKVRSGDGYP